MFDPAALGTAMIGLRATLADLDAAQSPARAPTRQRASAHRPARAWLARALRRSADVLEPRRPFEVRTEGADS